MSRTVYKSLPDLSKARNRKDVPATIRKPVVVPPSVKAFAAGRKYLIKTFGCQGNVRDEEILAGYLEAAGMTRTTVEKEAGMVLINTCAVRENAEEKVYGEIGKFKANRQKDPSFVLGICGCMMQEEGIAKKIKASYPYVNLIFGTHNIPEILNLLGEHLERKKDLVDVISYPGDIVENLPSTRLDRVKAFVNITYGCDKFCTYCIVPYTRGRERSRAKEDILSECKALVEEGYQEITLLGQNVNSYGKDFHDGTSFATILKEVAELGIPRLRFMTSHPWDFTDEMIDTIAAYPNIMPCIHLPVQSGSTSMLRIMGRRYSREQYLELVAKIKEKIPGCAITTDIIVGFPNETEEQFEETLSLCQIVQYDAAFTFIYSPRAGTPAAKMEDNVDEATKHARFDRLLKVVEEGVMSHSREMVGKTYRVLVDGPSKKDETMLSGYTETNKLVHFPGPAYLKGCIVEVRITEDHAFSMKGELLDSPVLILAKRLGKALANEPIAKEFLRNKKALEESPTLQALRKSIEEAQKAMMDCAAKQDDEGYFAAKKSYASLMDRYQNDPVVLNYQASENEMEGLLLEVEGHLK
ncbi:MAG: tRNA (N6-isopentenyl adenosine(37)-C2)-methylthiotransferase MiaB [Candidatus Enteromonas sp.]|nr:tRNA (N6-isopentenyl adenosine(37)-C2)-methylthiotransferase MiaB [Candidatus Enteromonas sp.]